MRTETAVVTGIGVFAPTGTSGRRRWASVLAGESGLVRITRFDPSGYPVRIAGEVPGFSATERVGARLVPQTARSTHLGLGAAEAALRTRRSGWRTSASTGWPW